MSRDRGTPRPMLAPLSLALDTAAVVTDDADRGAVLLAMARIDALVTPAPTLTDDELAHGVAVLAACRREAAGGAELGAIGLMH